MSNSLPDLIIPANTWIDVYAQTGIAVGKPLIIQNKINSQILVLNRPTIPTTTLDGSAIPATQTLYVGGTISRIWISCLTAGRVCVQENDEVSQ